MPQPDRSAWVGLFARALEGHEAAIDQVRRQQSRIVLAAELIRKSWMQGGKLLLMGNGGSAADSQHIAAEFLGRFQRDRDPLPALALTTDTSALTAIANDYGFDQIFARQIDGLARPEDVVLGISTSGNSRNVILAMDAASRKGCATIALTGEPGDLAARGDVHVGIRGLPTARVQEAHILVGHLLCELLDA